MNKERVYVTNSLTTRRRSKGGGEGAGAHNLTMVLRATLVKRREHIMPPFRLRIIRILNLEPALLRVNAHPSLGDHSLKVPFAHFLKQQLAVALDMLRV